MTGAYAREFLISHDTTIRKRYAKIEAWVPMRGDPVEGRWLGWGYLGEDEDSDPIYGFHVRQNRIIDGVEREDRTTPEHLPDDVAIMAAATVHDLIGVHRSARTRMRADQRQRQKQTAKAGEGGE